MPNQPGDKNAAHRCICLDDFFCWSYAWDWARKGNDDHAEGRGRNGVVDRILSGEVRELLNKRCQYRVWDFCDKGRKAANSVRVMDLGVWGETSPFDSQILDFAILVVQSFDDAIYGSGGGVVVVV